VSGLCLCLSLGERNGSESWHSCCRNNTGWIVWRLVAIYPAGYLSGCRIYTVTKITQKWIEVYYDVTVHPGNSSSNSSETGATSYRDGYSDCAREVATYLGRLHDAAAPGGVLVRTRVLAHLSASLRAVNSAHRRHVVPPTVPPTSSRLPVDEHCRVSTSFRTPAAVASSTTDIRLAALPAAATGTGSSHSLDGPTAAWSDTVAQRTATPPEDQKHHVTTTTLMMSPPTYDVNGNDVTTHDYPRSTPPAVLFADPKQDSSLVWRPW